MVARYKRKLKQEQVDDFGLSDTGYGIVLTRGDKEYQQATPFEITQAKMDSICPRCEKLVFIDPDGCRCPCGFSF